MFLWPFGYGLSNSDYVPYSVSPTGIGTSRQFSNVPLERLTYKL